MMFKFQPSTFSKAYEALVQLLDSLTGAIKVCCAPTRHNDDISSSIYTTGGNSKVVDALRKLEIECFRCPITFEIMEEPVNTKYGHAFERYAIER